VKYALKDGITGVTQQWLFQNVVPHIRRRYRNDTTLCNVLALPLLYACLGDNEKIAIPDELRNRVCAAYNALGNEEEQPVKKVPLCIYQVNDKLMIDPLTEDGVGVGRRSGLAAGPTPANHDEVQQAVLIRLNRLEQVMNQMHMGMQASTAELRHYCGTNFRVLNNNIRCYGGTIQGALVLQQQQQNNANDNPNNNSNERRQLHNLHAERMRGNQLDDVVNPARLSSNPRTLHQLWREYKFGLDGRKPAEAFTIRERNCIIDGTKQKYYRRNVVWQCIARLVRGGDTSERAIIKIRAAYGNDRTVTYIINKMVQDKKTGGHPNLL
jgi:hypothetical protein